MLYPKVSELTYFLQNMKKSHNYFAVVTDEFGGTYGGYNHNRPA